jgi:hypothetical protein
MRVYVANFGAGNWGWNECLATNSMMIMDDDRVHPFYLASKARAFELIAFASTLMRMLDDVPSVQTQP